MTLAYFIISKLSLLGIFQLVPSFIREICFNRLDLIKDLRLETDSTRAFHRDLLHRQGSILFRQRPSWERWKTKEAKLVSVSKSRFQYNNHNYQDRDKTKIILQWFALTYLQFRVYAIENWPCFWNLSSSIQSTLIFLKSQYLLHISRETNLYCLS